MFKKIIGRIVGGISKPGARSQKDIESYKSNAWKSKKVANNYFKYVEHPFFNEVTSKIFTENISSGSYVLDIGAGTGRLSFVLADNQCRVVSCDISKEMLDHINKHKGSRQLQTLESAAGSIPLQSETFDAVVSMDFMPHFPNWAELLKEQARLCRRGGVIMFNFLSSENTELLKSRRIREEGVDNFFTTDHGSFATGKQIEEIARSLGLTVESIYPYDFFSFNSAFGYNLNKSQINAFYKTFMEAIKDESVLHFVSQFERNIVRTLPLSSSVTMIVKLKKI